ncbi:MAG: hypothetical protein JXB88_09440 [Spirochaetales bacterium]|nr:hypothetical protein [Spirochaetales bacterium]
MKKRLCSYKLMLCVIIIIITGFSPLYSITQEDINTLISFAESIIKIAKEKEINITNITIEEYYITIIEEAYTELEKLFNEKGWTFENIEKILYPTGLVMSFKNEIDEDYVLDILTEEGITKKDIEIVLKNAEKLSKYFLSIDMDWTDEPDMYNPDIDEPDRDDSDVYDDSVYEDELPGE